MRRRKTEATPIWVRAGRCWSAQNDTTGKTWQLAVGAGKDSNLYVVDRTNMGKFSSTSNNIYQELAGALPGGIWAMPAAFNGSIYYGPVGSPLLRFQFKNAKLLVDCGGKEHEFVRVSGNDAERVGEQREECDRVGSGECQARRCCMPITRRLWWRSTTRTRRPAGAITSATGTNTSRR